MRHILEAIRGHALTDRHLGDLEGRASLEGNREMEAGWATARQANDLAYFLLAANLFESRVNQLCLGLTRNRPIRDIWPHGTGWAAARPDMGIIVRLSLSTRLAWLSDPAWDGFAAVKEYLEFKNRLASGLPPDTALVFPLAAKAFLDFLAKAEAELAQALAQR